MMPPIRDVFGEEMHPMQAALNARLTWADKAIATTMPRRLARFYLSSIRGFNIYLNNKATRREVNSEDFPDGVKEIVVMQPHGYELVKESWLREDEVICKGSLAQGQDNKEVSE